MSFAGVFEGQTEARASIGSVANLFEQPVWTETVQAAASEATQRVIDPDHPCEWYEREFLALVGTELARRGRVSVLDFGGGPGTTFVSVVGKLGFGELSYDIVDTPENCRIGEGLLGGDRCVRFLPADPDNDLQFVTDHDHYDIVLSSSTLQYSKNWRLLLERFTSFEPEHIVLPRLLTGSMPTFTTVQTVTMSYGPHKGTVAGQIPCTFLNRAELAEWMKSLGYRVSVDVFGSSYQEPLNGLPQPFCNGQLRTVIFSRHD